MAQLSSLRLSGGACKTSKQNKNKYKNVNAGHFREENHVTKYNCQSVFYCFKKPKIKKV